MCIRDRHRVRLVDPCGKLPLPSMSWTPLSETLIKIWRIGEELFAKTKAQLKMSWLACSWETMIPSVKEKKKWMKVL